MSELDEIEARVNRHGVPGGIAVTPSDVAYLLDLARKQAAALARVGVACDAMDAGTAIRSGDHRTKSFAAQAIRAVIREELEGKP